MSRIRTVKPEMFDDPDVAELTLGARWLFIGLLTQADRLGRLVDDPRRFKVRICPYDDCDVGAQLDELIAGRFIVRYQVDGAKFIQIRTFEKHQRPHQREAESVLPPNPNPASTAKAKRGQTKRAVEGTGKAVVGIALAVPSTLEKGRVLEGEKGRDIGNGEGSTGKGERSSAKQSLAGVSVQVTAFARFWDLYPRKEGKQDAWKSWQKLDPDDETNELIIAAIIAQRNWPNWIRESGKYIPHPATWLNGARWTDERMATPSIGTTERTAGNVEAARRFAEREVTS